MSNEQKGPDYRDQEILESLRLNKDLHAVLAILILKAGEGQDGYAVVKTQLFLETMKGYTKYGWVRPNWEWTNKEECLAEEETNLDFYKTFLDDGNQDFRDILNDPSKAWKEIKDDGNGKGKKGGA